MMRRFFQWGVACLVLLLILPVASAPPKGKDKTEKKDTVVRKNSAAVKVGKDSCATVDVDRAELAQKQLKQKVTFFNDAARLTVEGVQTVTKDYWALRMTRWADGLRKKTSVQAEGAVVRQAYDGGWTAKFCHAVASRDAAKCKGPSREAEDRCRLLVAIYGNDISRCDSTRDYAQVCRLAWNGGKGVCKDPQPGRRVKDHMAPSCANLAKVTKSIGPWCSKRDSGFIPSECDCAGAMSLRAKLTTPSACTSIQGFPVASAICQAIVQGKPERCTALYQGQGQVKGGARSGSPFKWEAHSMVVGQMEGIGVAVWIRPNQPAICHIHGVVKGKDGNVLEKIDTVLTSPDLSGHSESLVVIPLQGVFDPWSSRGSIKTSCTRRYWW
jgi:hypothetical protein